MRNKRAQNTQNEHKHLIKKRLDSSLGIAMIIFGWTKRCHILKQSITCHEHILGMSIRDRKSFFQKTHLRLLSQVIYIL